MTERIIIGIKHSPKNNPTVGLISAIAEDINGKLSSITDDNFCPSRKVFIVAGYDEIDKLQENELFQIKVEINQQTQSGPCKYKAFGRNAEKVKDIAEVLYANSLPDRNSRILEVNEFPVTKYIFIQTESNDCYGPFDWEKKNIKDEKTIELKIITSGGLGKNSGGVSRQVCKIPQSKINFNSVNCGDNFGNRKLAKNIYNIIGGPDVSLEEYANDKEIIEEIKKMAGDSLGRTIDKKNLDQLIALVNNKKDSALPLNKSRILTFGKIIANSSYLTEVNEVIESYLKSPAGAEVLEIYVQRNREKYIDKLRGDKEIELGTEVNFRKNELQQINNSIESLKKEKLDLSDKIEEIKRAQRDVQTNPEFDIEIISKKHQERIADLNHQTTVAENRLAEIKGRIGKLSEVDDIQKSVIAKQGVLDHIQQQIEEKKKDRDTILEESRRAEDDIRKKLRGMKPYVDHLNGSFSEGELDKPDIKVSCVEFNGKKDIHTQRLIINSIKNGLSLLGRSLNDQEVANLLISKQQSFITFFAGLPGVGKTSMCKLMANAEGLEKRLHSVSVARGWTSSKDILGFHNPLNDKFQPASTGMYEFLSAINAELKTGDKTTMSYILLDEANLSSIEHYWSAFMGMTDAITDQNLPIGQGSLVIPRNLRFLATINYDGTTEPLSPRILDRAAVIVMRPGEIVPRQSIDESALQQAFPIHSEHMDSLFGLFNENETPEFEAGEKSAIEAIAEVLRNSSIDKGRSIHISQRKMNAIRQYCGRARPIMRSDGEVIALDWAVIQHILPQVTGHGNKFGNRLIALKKCFEDHDLEKSADYLDQMILSGKNNLHSYEFFCW